MPRRDVVMVALLASWVGAGCAKTEVEPEKPKLDEVLISKPTEDEVVDYKEFIGHTDAMFSVEVRARVTGYLDKVHFNDGDEVEKGALLFKIDSRPYQATYDQTRAMLEMGNAKYIQTSADHRRADALYQKNAIGREEYDRIQSEYAQSKASIGAAKATLDMAELNLDWTKVVAPISGRLSRRMVDPGNLVKLDDTLLTTIVSLDPMYVNFDIDERTMLEIRRLIAEGRMKSREQAVVPILVGLSDEDDFPHKGTINFSDNKLDSSTGTLRVRGVIDNPKPRLLSPGLFAKVRLPIGDPHKSLLISEQAIGTDQSNKFVYVVKKGKVKATPKVPEHEGQVIYRQDIKLGRAVKGLRVIDQGLKLGDRVVVSGLQRVRVGKEVNPTPLEEFNKKLGDKAASKLAETPASTAPAPPIAAIDPVGSSSTASHTK